MINILIILAGFVLVFVLMLGIFAWREARRQGTSVREEFIGICSVAVERASQKEIKKEEIISLFQEREDLFNADIR